MEQFMKLPPAQKAAVLAGILVVMALAMYFLLVDPELGRAEVTRAQLKKVESDIVALKETASNEAREKHKKEKDELVEIDKENRKMLPSADEIPDFIESVQRDAAQVGLVVNRFDRLPEENEELYNAIPIKMTVEGTTLHFIQFLRMYAGTERRVINIRDLSIERVAPNANKIKDLIAARRPLEAQKKEGTKSPEAILADAIEFAELARQESTIRATFTAYAFVWTGKPASADGVRREKPKKRRT